MDFGSPKFSGLSPGQPDFAARYFLEVETDPALSSQRVSASVSNFSYSSCLSRICTPMTPMHHAMTRNGASIACQSGTSASDSIPRLPTSRSRKNPATRTGRIPRRSMPPANSTSFDPNVRAPAVQNFGALPAPRGGTSVATRAGRGTAPSRDHSAQPNFFANAETRGLR